MRRRLGDGDADADGCAGWHNVRAAAIPIGGGVEGGRSALRRRWTISGAAFGRVEGSILEVWLIVG